MKTLEELLGGQSALDVADVCTKRLKRKFPNARHHDVEDAVGFAVVDLYDYWVSLPSSQKAETPEDAFRLACKRAEWTATRILTQDWHDSAVPMEELSAPDSTYPALSSTNVEYEVVERDAMHELYTYIEDRWEDEAAWLDPFLRGVSASAHAEATNQDRFIVARRWRKNLARFAGQARHDLAVA